MRVIKNDERLAKLVADSARKFYLADKNCPLTYEPSGEDFLSPCLGEADVMRRVLTQTEFAKWLNAISASNSENGDGGLVAGGDFARSERSQAGASRRIKFESSVDAGRHSLFASCR